jgi:ABC-2 type transport system ATP-binding protein
MLYEARIPDAVVKPRDRAQLSRLDLRGISKQWGAHVPPVLHDVDLRLAPASVTAVVGRNGSGKTTLLRIAAGLIAPDRGTVALDGLDPFVNRRRYQQRLGFVSAGQGGLYARLTVWQHLELWSRLAFIPPRERPDAVAAAVEGLGLGGKESSRVDRLSAGQRQRVRIAMAFLHRPPLALLDEPHNSLDDDGIAALAALVRDLVEAGGSVVCCAPTPTSLGFPVDEVYVVDGGHVVQA